MFNYFFLTLFLLFSFAACTKKTADLTFNNYPPCEVKVNDEFTNFPWDIAANSFRSDVGHSLYEKSNTIRPFVLFGSQGKAVTIGEELIDIFGEQYLFFNSWSYDGNNVYVTKKWEDPYYAMWEKANQKIQYEPTSYLFDLYTININSEKSINLTSQNRTSFYNHGVFLWPSDPTKIGFHAIVEGVMQPFIMNLDGSQRTPLFNANQITYGTVGSPDGKMYANHSGYKINIGYIGTQQTKIIQNNFVFNMVPLWSPDSKKVAFFCGEANITADICIADVESLTSKVIASRNGYEGYILIRKPDDVHPGATDNIAWTNDSKKIIYTAKNLNTKSLDLYAVDIITSQVTQLTYSYNQNEENYFPVVSPDGKWLMYGSNKTGNRDIFILNLENPQASPLQVTAFEEDCSSAFFKFRPKVAFTSL